MTDFRVENPNAGGVTIGGLVVGGTPGSVLFIDSSGNLGQDNPDFFYEATDNVLLLGYTNPTNSQFLVGTNTESLVVAGTSFTPKVFVDATLTVGNSGETFFGRVSSDSATGPLFGGFKSRGTVASPTIVNAGDTLFGIYALGYDGADYNLPSSLLFVVDPEDTPGANDVAGAMILGVSQGGDVPKGLFRLRGIDYTLRANASMMIGDGGAFFNDPGAPFTNYASASGDFDTAIVRGLHIDNAVSADEYAVIAMEGNGGSLLLLADTSQDDNKKIIGYHYENGFAFFRLMSNDLTYAATEYLRFDNTTGSSTFNNYSLDQDFIVHGLSSTNLIFADASLLKVTITGSEAITVTGTTALVVEQAAGTDTFRVDTTNLDVYTQDLLPIGTNDIGVTGTRYRHIFLSGNADITTNLIVGGTATFNGASATFSSGGETFTITPNSPSNYVTLSCDSTSNLYIDSGGDTIFDIFGSGAGLANFFFYAGGSATGTSISDLGYLTAKRLFVTESGETLTIIANSPSNYVRITTNPTSHLELESGGDIDLDVLNTSSTLRILAGGVEQASFTGTGGLVLSSVEGVDCNPGSDADTDCLTIGVTGTPRVFWDESEDAFSATKDILVPDEAYGSGWNGLLEVPTKNAVYDKIESQIGCFVRFVVANFSPVDAETLYMGSTVGVPVTTAGQRKLYFRKACTIKVGEVYTYSTTAGSNEAWSFYIRLNDTTDTLIATVSAATNERIFSNTGLSIAIAANDFIEIKCVNPTWGTNPVTVSSGGYVYVE